MPVCVKSILSAHVYMQTWLFIKLMYMQTYLVHIIINYVNNNMGWLKLINLAPFWEW